jgi:maltose alpha-D-glucosyltransferase / alpha-amylase
MDLWYKDAVIYSLDVETFIDSNGDGVGDFRGLAGKLDYLHSLDVSCLWLLPFYPTPNRDNGYDVSDFYGVDRRLGTLGDFLEFTRSAGERGIRVLIDLVVNHTSIDHPWFQEARRNRKSVYRDYYLWRDQKPENADEGVVFPGVQESTWTWDESADAWYFHRFYEHQPDLNIANPRVRDEIARIMSFWLQLGVSGFRVDAAPFLIEHIDRDDPQHDVHEYLREFRNYLSWRRGDAIMLAEANVEPAQITNYLDHGDKIQMMLNFFANQHVFLSLAREDAEAIRQAYASLPDLPGTCQWTNFLRNHDELDLGRLSETERDDVFSRFAPDPRMRLYERGIRRRLAPMLENDRRRLELAHSLLLTLPGTPVLRYGDEIGMGDDLSLDERDSVRTPMQWNSGPNGGFSRAPADELFRPVPHDGEFGCEAVNVASQQRDPESLLAWTQRVVRVRRGCRELGWGACTFLPTENRHVLAHRCSHEGRTVVLLHNLAGEKQSVEVTVDPHTVPADLLTRDEPEVRDGRLCIELPPYGYRWFRLVRDGGEPGDPV